MGLPWTLAMAWPTPNMADKLTSQSEVSFSHIAKICTQWLLKYFDDKKPWQCRGKVGEATLPSGFAIIGFPRTGFASKRLCLQILWLFRFKLGCLLVQSCLLYVGFHLGSTVLLFPRLWPRCCQPSHWAPRDPLRSWSTTSMPSRNDSTFLTPSFQGLTFHCAGCNIVLGSVFRITVFSHLRLGVMSCRLCFSDMISDLFCFYDVGVFCIH